MNLAVVQLNDRTDQLTATFAVLGATSVLLLDRGLRQNVDDSLTPSPTPSPTLSNVRLFSVP